jgi:hypothetical protein
MRGTLGDSFSQRKRILWREEYPVRTHRLLFRACGDFASTISCRTYVRMLALKQTQLPVGHAPDELVNFLLLRIFAPKEFRNGRYYRSG